MRLRRLLARIGPIGVVGIGVAIAAAMLRLGVARPLADEVDALRAEVERADARPRTAVAAAPKRRDTDLEQLYEILPATASAGSWLVRIESIARKNGIALEVGEYKLLAEGGPRLAAYRMQLPVRAGYAQIRGFVGDLMKQVPAAAIEDIDLGRDEADSRRIEARIRLTLYLDRGAP